MVPQNTKILLVDDEELVRQLLARILADAGFMVEQADNGASALQAARRLDGSLDLVITDIDMPVMSGLELARALRQTDRRIPFLFITGVDPALVYKAGFPARVLWKPFTPEAFMEAVTQMVTPASGPGRLA
jgi:two-component system chemotaxis response regulator CheY